MRIPRSAPITAMSLLALAAIGCGEPAPKSAPPPPAATTAPPPPPPPAEPATVTPPPTSSPAPTPTPGPTAKATPAVRPPKAPASKAPAPPVREKLGAGQCRSCHRLQYDSWVKSGHARKALDCEGCHGNGSEYATAAVMKDLAAAKRAGLIFQTAAFCEKCHPTADDSFLPKAHAHPKK